MKETFEEQQKRLKLEMDAAFCGRDITTMTEKEILEMELAYALMGKGELTIEELMKVPEFIALTEYNGRHWLDDETPEEMAKNDQWAEELKRKVLERKRKKNK